MSEWQEEPGPNCFCGWPTFVSLVEVGSKTLPILVCIGHTREAGATFCLPSDRPDHWPNLSNEEMQALVERGIAEHQAEEEA